jgi:hypothetical protein
LLGRAGNLTMNEVGTLKSDGAEPASPIIKAEDNPRYLLATLYGVPGLRLLLRVHARYPALASLVTCGHVSRHGNSLGSHT